MGTAGAPLQRTAPRGLGASSGQGALTEERLQTLQLLLGAPCASKKLRERSPAEDAGGGAACPSRSFRIRRKASEAHLASGSLPRGAVADSADWPASRRRCVLQKLAAGGRLHDGVQESRGSVAAENAGACGSAGHGSELDDSLVLTMPRRGGHTSLAQHEARVAGLRAAAEDYAWLHSPVCVPGRGRARAGRAWRCSRCGFAFQQLSKATPMEHAGRGCSGSLPPLCERAALLTALGLWPFPLHCSPHQRAAARPPWEQFRGGGGCDLRQRPASRSRATAASIAASREVATASTAAWVAARPAGAHHPDPHGRHRMVGGVLRTSHRCLVCRNWYDASAMKLRPCRRAAAFSGITAAEYCARLPAMLTTLRRAWSTVKRSVTSELRLERAARRAGLPAAVALTASCWC